MIIFHANLNKMQTLWVPRISVWIRGKNNKGACSLFVVRKHLLEANTCTYSNEDSDKCIGWTLMTPDHYHQPDVHPGSSRSNQWGVLRNTQFLCFFENHRQESILPQGYLIKVGLSKILCLNLTLTWRLPPIYLFSCPQPHSPFLGLCKQHCN